MGRNFIPVVLIVALGAAIGLLLPKTTTTTIVFEPGGRYTVGAAVRGTLPGQLHLTGLERLRLRVVNRDSLPRQAGVLGLRSGDSLVVPAEACTGTHSQDSITIALR